jgi:hypothetical protein
MIRSQILAADGLLAIVTSQQSDWVQNEIGMAYAAFVDKRPIYGLVENQVEKVEGILPLVSTYKRFSRGNTFELRKLLGEIAQEFIVEAAAQAYGVVDPTDMLVDSSGTILLAVRPRQSISSDEVITIYVPPEFDLSQPFNNPETMIKTDIPSTAVDTMLGRSGDRYPDFWYVKCTLRFPEVRASLRGVWFGLRVMGVKAPSITGTYRFYGTDEIQVMPARVEASPFDFHQIIVKGEITPAPLSGTISIRGGKTLTLPGLVNAIGTVADPYTGRLTGRMVEGRCYFTSKEKGQYVMSGLAPGVYTIYASALGYSTYVIAQNLSIRAPTTLDGQIDLTMSDVDRASELARLTRLNDDSVTQK